MIKQIRKIKPKSDKFFEAIQFARELVNFLNEKYPELKSEVFWERFGDAQTLHFYFQYDNLADFEGKVDKLMADKDFLAINNKGMILFVDGAQRITMIQSI
jgi:hypothetical protein